MGIDTRVTLPADCSISNVTTAIGILAGLPKTCDKLEGTNLFVTRVRGAKYLNQSYVAELTLIQIDGISPAISEESLRTCFYHFEWGEHGKRGISARTSAFWIAIAKRLVEFFGGEVDYNDCDDIECDYSCERMRTTNNPQDGESWHQFQQELYQITPITTQELQWAEHYVEHIE